MVRPTKKYTQPQAEVPDEPPRRRYKDKYFETPDQRRSKHDGRAASAAPSPEVAADAAPEAGPIMEEPTVEIVIDLREDAVYADEPRGEHYYLRMSATD